MQRIPAQRLLVSAAIAVSMMLGATRVHNEGIKTNYLFPEKALQACKEKIQSLLSHASDAVVPDIAPVQLSVGGGDVLNYWRFVWDGESAVRAPGQSQKGTIYTICGVNWTNGRVKFVFMDGHKGYTHEDERLVPLPPPVSLIMNAS